MIARLLNEVVASAGVEIRTSGDCHTLSEVITERTGKVVNYNTLRRMYGLAKPVKPSRGSLDILSEFIGFDSYLHFTSGSPRLHSTRTKEEVFLRFARGHRLFPKQQPWKRRYDDLATRLGFTRFDDAFFKTAYRKITPLQP